jgi:hypothetical protein
MRRGSSSEGGDVKRLFSHLFAILSAVSLLLCLAVCALWVRSYYYRDILDVGRDGGNSHTAQSILGRLHLVSNLSGRRVSSETFYSSDRLSPNAIWNGGMSSYPARVEWYFGCVWQRYLEWHNSIMGETVPPPSPHRLIVVPYRWLTLLFAILPAMTALPMIRRRRRFGIGKCIHCGYDLRASPEQCPECGAATSSATGPKKIPI